MVNGNAPTFAFASVNAFKVVDLPLDGFPTSPITISLPMGDVLAHCVFLEEEGFRYNGRLLWIFFTFEKALTYLVAL